MTSQPRRLRFALVLAVLAAALAACGRQRSDAPASANAPIQGAGTGGDVLLITIDTLRADAVGFMGNTAGTTPNLDRLAAAGRVYPRAHAHNVVTLPSHTNILAGRLPYQHGVRDNAGYTVPATLPTMATLLDAAGYATAAFVGAYPLDSRYGLDRGFDIYDDDYPRGSRPEDFDIAERRGDLVVGPALAWWRAQRQQPRFLWVHLYDPHAGYDPPQPFRARFPDRLYLGEVAAADAFLAPLLDEVVAGSAQRPALIVVTADHGEALGDHGELTHGLFAYESTLQVPLLVWGTGIPAGRDQREAWHVDILPTVLARTGVAAPAGLPGVSLLAQGADGAPERAYFEAVSTHLNRGWAPLRGTLEGGRKWIDLPLPELYDLNADAAERNNLWPAERRLAAELRAALPVDAPWPPPVRAATVSTEETNRLRSLGYIVGEAPAKSQFTADDDPKTLLPVDHKLHQAAEAYELRDYARCIALAREVIAARPEIAEGYAHAALALRQLERHAEAIQLLESGLGRVVARESHERQLAMALSEAGQAAPAAALLRPYGATGEPATLKVLAVALSDAGRHAEGLEVIRLAAQRDPDDPKTMENQGIILLQMGRAAEARASLEQALRRNDALPISWNTLGVARYQLEGPARAIEAWQRAVTLDPRQFDALFNLGLVAAKQGQTAQARSALRQFVATAPPARFGPDLAKARALLRELGG